MAKPNDIIVYPNVGYDTGETAKTKINTIKKDLYQNLELTSIATAAGTTILTVNSNNIYEFTGSTTQTIQMPVVSNLFLGYQFKIINNSTGILTVNSSGSNLITTIPTGQTKIITCVKITGTDETSWNVNDFGGGISSVEKDPFTTTIEIANLLQHSPNYTQTGTLNITKGSGTFIGGAYQVLIKTNGDVINFSSDFIVFNNDYSALSIGLYLFIFSYMPNGKIGCVVKNTFEDVTSPEIIGFSSSGLNTYVDITFSEGLYGANDGPVSVSDLQITNFVPSGATALSIGSITNTSDGVLVGGESVIRVVLSIAGTPAGTETFEVKPIDGISIYDESGNVMSASETTGTITLVLGIDIVTDLTAHYPFNGNADDETGNGNDGTVNNGTLTTGVGGIPNSAYLLNGTNANITVPDSADLNFGSGNGTICVWVKATSITPAGTPIIDKRTTAGYQINSVDRGAGTELIFLLHDGTNQVVAEFNESETTSWKHIAVGIDRDNDLALLYLDGVLIDSVDISTITGSLTNTEGLHIGSNSIEDKWYDGIVDNVRIYQRLLTTEQIQYIHSNNL